MDSGGRSYGWCGSAPIRVTGAGEALLPKGDRGLHPRHARADDDDPAPVVRSALPRPFRDLLRVLRLLAHLITLDT